MHIVQTLQEIYQKPSNVIQTAFWIIFFAALISLLQNLSQIISILGYSLLSLQKVQVIYSILTNFYTDNVRGLALFLHGTLILLMSINITCILHYFKKRGNVSSGKETTLATLLALIGSGCAACGGILASTGIATLGGVSSILAAPFIGELFLYIAIALLVYSIHSVSRKITAPFVC